MIVDFLMWPAILLLAYYLGAILFLIFCRIIERPLIACLCFVNHKSDIWTSLKQHGFLPLMQTDEDYKFILSLWWIFFVYIIMCVIITLVFLPFSLLLKSIGTRWFYFPFKIVIEGFKKKEIKNEN